MQHALRPVDPAGDSTTILPVHPVTGLRALGLTRRGPVWPVLGGSGEDDGSTGEDGSAGDDSGSNDSGGQDGDGGADSGRRGDGGRDDSTKPDSKAAPKEIKDLPTWAQKIIRDARKQAGDERNKVTAVEKSMQDKLDGIAVALGLKKGEEVDPKKLADQLTAERDKAAQDAQDARTELAVVRAADDHKADPGALLDSREFMREVRELDATGKDFAKDLAELIKARVKDNPKRYGRDAPAPSKSGSDGMTGGRGKPPRSGSLYEAITATTNQQS